MRCCARIAGSKLRTCTGGGASTFRPEESLVDGRLGVTVKRAKPYGEPIRLTTARNGQGGDRRGCNGRILLQGNPVELHDAPKRAPGRVGGTQALGVDKG